MKQIYIIAMSVILMSACNESVSYRAHCDSDEIGRCIDDYHYKVCTADGPVALGCCSEGDIRSGICLSVCMMRESGAVCENIQAAAANSVCGNQIVESGELCDGMQLNGHSCADRYGIQAEGQALCDPVTCRVNYDNCRPLSTECGNGVLDLGEDCDGNELREQSCNAEIANATGSLKCTSQCKYDYSDCHVEMCGNGELNAGESCDGSVPDGLTCANIAYGMRGNLACDDQCKIDTSDCHWPEAGDLCSGDEYHLQTCGDNNQAIKCKGGVIQVADCTKQSETCVMIQNDDIMTAGCMPERMKCLNPGEMSNICDSDGYSSVQMECTDSANDRGSYWMKFSGGHVEQCPYSCSPETGECTRLVSDQGEECDPETFNNHCNGNISVNCRLQTFRYAVEAEACTQCDVISDSGNDIAVCVNDALECKPGDDDLQICYNDESLHKHCVKNAAGDKAYMLTSDVSSCEHGCDAETGACVKLYDTEGNTCKEFFKSRCIEGDILLYCSDNMRITAVACNEDGNGYCGNGECYELCEKAGIKRSKCFADGDSAYTVIEECRKTDGRLHYEIVDTETCGLGYCNYNGDACFKFSDIDGEPCDPGYYECKDELMIICDNGKKVSYDCQMYQMVCAESEDFGAYCMEPCSEPGQETTSCEYYDDEYGYVKYDMVCRADPNGVLYYEAISGEACPGQCNEDRTDCESCELGVTDTYCYKSDMTYYTIYAACQVDDKGRTYFDYLKDENGDYIYDECPSKCDESGKQCLQILDEQGDECSKADYESKCSDNYALYCSNSGHVAATNCTSGTTCQVSETFGANCVGTCSKEMPVTRYCDVYPDYGAIAFEVACENIDGNLYEFQNFLGYCVHGCNKLKSDCEIK
ncbi:MAG: hypothetical protein J6A01_00015 [Proteobacteria bacterium]|nr:hypothetical protein [Pseudomonadota bacterium]